MTHPYRKAVDAFALYPFIPRKNLQSLVLQGIGDSSCDSAFQYMSGYFAQMSESRAKHLLTETVFFKLNDFSTYAKISVTFLRFLRVDR